MPRKIRALAIALLMLMSIVVGQITYAPTQHTSVDVVNAQTESRPFISVVDGQFRQGDNPHYFVGVNFWQGMNLGVDDERGNRDQLLIELDRLQAMGITNLRVMASSEGPNTEPYRMTPALMLAPGEYDTVVFDGLDFLLAEMGKRDMYAVMVLNNYWQWSGGMAQYVAWATKDAIPYPGDWNRFMNFSAEFYECAECQTWYRAHIETLINRENPYNGLNYANDPAIFAWELANEPRRYPDSWIDDTADYIKSLDSNHMVTVGSEGTPPWETIDFTATHDGANIDYTTIHIWPQNWGWYDPRDVSTYDAAETQALAYFAKHVALANELNKPLVLEEFGLARDWQPVEDPYDPASTTTYRDKFYATMFSAVYNSMQAGEAAAGDNIWVWSGDLLPTDDWVGDPLHETPGWYSVYATDESTIAIIEAHAREMQAGRE